jgi:hypothetical protein
VSRQRPKQTRKGQKKQHKKARIGNPATHKPRHKKRREAKERFMQPDATEQVVSEMNRKMRALMHEAPAEDGAVIGPLRIAAEHLVAQIQKAHGLEGEEHKAAIVEYLVGCWGEVAHAFPEKPDIPGYHQHREKSVARAREALAE